MKRIRAARDEGFIIFALLALMVLGGVGTVVLGTILTSEHVNRHDVAFAQSLAAAEAGLDAMTAQIKVAPLSSGFAAISDSDPTTGATYTTSATGGSGHWVVTSQGTATRADSTVTRTIQQSVDTQNVLATPMFGRDHVSLGGLSGASGVDTYDSAVSSAVCTPSGVPATLLSYDTRMCQPASPALGNVATDGPLTEVGADASRTNSTDIYDAAQGGYADPDATGSCVGDATTCSTATVHTHRERLDYPVSSLCSQGIGAGAAAYDGSFALAANAVYNFTNVTLNVQAIANLANLGGSRIVICFSGTLVVPPLLQLNSSLSSLLPVSLTPRAPSSLLLISTSNGSNNPQVDFGLSSAVTGGVALPVLSTLPTSLSAVVYAPNATCQANGHVDLYGAIVCKSIDATQGLDVHYDTELGNLDFDRPVVISHWIELKGKQ